MRRVGRYGTLYRRRGPGLRVLILPGLGCPATEHTGPASEHLPVDWDIEVWEAPGAGTTPFRGPGQSTVEELVAGLIEVSAPEGERFGGATGRLVIGHSLGGLVGLLLCERRPAGVGAFVNVEGNLGPADCVFTARAARLDRARFESDWLPQVIERLGRAPMAGERQYAAALSGLASPEAYHVYSRSIVAHSARPRLVDSYLRLPMPTLYVHGADSGDPATVARLRAGGDVVAISGAGHFPHVDRPEVFWPLVRGWTEAVFETRGRGRPGQGKDRVDGEAGS